MKSVLVLLGKSRVNLEYEIKASDAEIKNLTNNLNDQVSRNKDLRSRLSDLISAELKLRGETVNGDVTAKNKKVKP